MKLSSSAAEGSAPGRTEMDGAIGVLGAAAEGPLSTGTPLGRTTINVATAATATTANAISASIAPDGRRRPPGRAPVPGHPRPPLDGATGCGAVLGAAAIGDAATADSNGGWGAGALSGMAVAPVGDNGLRSTRVPVSPVRRSPDGGADPAHSGRSGACSGAWSGAWSAPA